MKYDYCKWCGLKTEKFDGPIHKYLESSPGCWAKYGELLIKEYENYEYMSVHGLTVDAYALQHPGGNSPQTMSSIYVHLASLYSYFELKKPIDDLAGVKKKMVRYKDKFIWLTPPSDSKDITVANVLASNSATEHRVKAIEWAEYIFRRWKIHHSKIADILTINTYL